MSALPAEADMLSARHQCLLCASGGRACERPALPQRSASVLLVETIDRVTRTPDASF